MSLRTNLKHLTGASLTTFVRHLSHHALRLSQPDPHSLLTEDSFNVLSDIWVKSYAQPKSKPFQNLTGFLLKPDLWVLAYQRAYAHATGASFPPKNTISPKTLTDLFSLQNAVVRSEFKWNSKLENFIVGPNEKPTEKAMSKTKIASLLKSKTAPFQDRIVQEVLLMVLEPVFEPRFSPKSHAFRPGRNAHTVIRTIRSNFAGYLWFIRGDLTDVFDGLDVNLMMGFVEEAVKDKKVLRLIKSGLKGIVKNNSSNLKNDDGEEASPRKEKKARTKKRLLSKNEPKPDPYWLRTFFGFAPEEASKVPEYGSCGILSPLLSNICLDALDEMLERKTVEFFRPNESDSIWKHSIHDGSHNPSWPEFVPSSGPQKTRKMDFVRHGAHFLVAIRGPRDEAVSTRRAIISFCESKLGVRLDNSKLEIEHITRGIPFLDHIISRRVVRPTLRYTSSQGKIVSQRGVGTLLSVTASLQRCVQRFRRLELVKGGPDPEPLPCKPMLYSGQAHTNSQMNKLLETMADWYRYADNRKKIVGFCAYIVRSSLAKLYAARYRLKSRAKVYGIASRNLSRPLVEKSNNSAPEYTDLLRMGLVDAIEGVRFSRAGSIPSCDYEPFPRGWVPEHERAVREYVKMNDVGLFCELSRLVKEGNGLCCLPQDEVSKFVWEFKMLRLWRDR